MKALHSLIFLTLISFINLATLSRAEEIPFVEGPIPAGSGYPEVPSGFRGYRDIPYVTEGHYRQKLDLYLPVGSLEGAPLPLIVSVHGGGFYGGSKNSASPFREGFGLRGYAVASINYRYSTEALFPAQIEDAKASIRWLRAHAEEFNLDSDHIAVWGHSAGGRLVAMLAATGNTKIFDKGENLEFSSSVQAAVAYSGVFDLPAVVEQVLAEKRAIKRLEPVSLLIGESAVDPKSFELLMAASPMTYITEEMAPILIAHGTEDETVPVEQSFLLYNKLKESGVSSHYMVIKGAKHTLKDYPKAITTPVVADFFERYLRENEGAFIWPGATLSVVASDPRL